MSSRLPEPHPGPSFASYGGQASLLVEGKGKMMETSFKLGNNGRENDRFPIRHSI